MRAKPAWTNDSKAIKFAAERREHGRNDDDPRPEQSRIASGAGKFGQVPAGPRGQCGVLGESGKRWVRLQSAQNADSVRLTCRGHHADAARRQSVRETVGPLHPVRQQRPDPPYVGPEVLESDRLGLGTCKINACIKVDLQPGRELGRGVMHLRHQRVAGQPSGLHHLGRVQRQWQIRPGLKYPLFL